MELGEWAAYFAQPPCERRKLFNIVSLSLANTPHEVRRQPFDDMEACDCVILQSIHSVCIQSCHALL